jgi:hypothetical protein
MDSLAIIRRTGLGLLGTALGALMLAAVAHSNELGASGSASTLVIHDADETLRDWCLTDGDGKLWLQIGGGARFELVTSIDDGAIVNKGDGSFHPFERFEIEAALTAMSYPVSDLRVDVFILPYPRRGGLESAAGLGVILLSPGVRPLSREQQHAEFVHEFGHVVQYARLPDSDIEDWSDYRRLRGIEDPTRFNEAATHESRPHEIFAEDFRALFGGATANYSGAIENATLTPPQQVDGLREFVLSLDGPALQARLSGAPNPSRGAVTFARAGASDSPVDVFDVSGRRLATLAPLAVSGGTEWRWDGRDARGGANAPAIVFARERGAGASPARITLLP